MKEIKSVGRPKKYDELKTLSVSLDLEMYEQFDRIASILSLEKSELFKIIFIKWRKDVFKKAFTD